MAISKAKRSIKKKQSAFSSQQSAKANSKAKKKQLVGSKPGSSTVSKQRAEKTKSRTKQSQPRAAVPHEKNKQSKQIHRHYPGELALQKKILSGRRFVWFPVAEGKTIKKIEFYTSREYHCLRLDFRDRTFLALQITPRFTLNADYQQRAKDEPVPLAEWPAIQSQR